MTLQASNAPPAPTDAQAEPWHTLRQFTQARIAQGRAGPSMPTGPLLAFQLAHAQARDAVHLPLDVVALTGALQDGAAPLHVQSAAPDRHTYLRRPDLGRRLSDASRTALTAAPQGPFDFAFVVGDGLSARAVQAHAEHVVRLARQALSNAGLSIAPVIIATQARVALGDEIGAALGAQQVAMLIGERPGLSAADSLGIYLTYAPRVGRQDAERNCISNIRPDGGLDYEQAAHTLVWLALEARRRRLTGVALKDESARHPMLASSRSPG